MPASRIMIAEDDQFMLSSLVFCLKNLGHKVLQAKDGHVAVAQLLESRTRREEVDLLLLDLQMPGKDGFELIVDLLRLDFDLPILVISGHWDRETLLKLKHLGCRDFLGKPFEPGELKAKVREILGRRIRLG